MAKKTHKYAYHLPWSDVCKANDSSVPLTEVACYFHLDMPFIVEDENGSKSLAKVSHVDETGYLVSQQYAYKGVVYHKLEEVTFDQLVPLEKIKDPVKLHKYIEGLVKE